MWLLDYSPPLRFVCVPRCRLFLYYFFDPLGLPLCIFWAFFPGLCFLLTISAKAVAKLRHPRRFMLREVTEILLRGCSGCVIVCRMFFIEDFFESCRVRL